GWSATIPGGFQNSAGGSYAFAAGYLAHADAAGCFTWADSSSDDPTSCSAANQFTARSSGGGCFYTNSPRTSGVYVGAGSSTWNVLSDRNKKRDIVPVDPSDVLERLAHVPIATWSYKDESGNVRHMGPMAQDFYGAFHLGDDDRHVATVDPDGVA